MYSQVNDRRAGHEPANKLRRHLQKGRLNGRSFYFDVDHASRQPVDRPSRWMAMTDLIAKVWGDEVIVVHQRQGHTYRFPVLGGTMVHLRGARIEANPRARRNAEGYLHEAHHAACAAFIHRGE
jgi:hypothetical protein